MKIALIIYGSLDQKTGGYIYDSQIVSGLRRRGHTIFVQSLDSDRRVSSVLHAMRSIARFSPDIIVGDELCFRELLPLFSRFHRTPRVLLVHHLSAWETERTGAEARWVAASERALLRISDRVVVTSGYSRKRLQKEGIAAAAILPGADRLASFGHASPEPRDIRFLFIGTLTPRKRLLELVNAFSRVSNSDASLHLVGDSSRDTEYAARVQSLCARDSRVVVRGVLNDRDLAQALSEASALVLPSSFEGYGMVITEAIHHGVPIVATAVGAIPEATGEGEHALLVNVEDLHVTLQRLASDESLRTRMRHAATEKARMLPTWREATTAFESVLDELHQAAATQHGPTP